MDGLVGAFIAMLVYGVIGIAVLVMLIREKWRRGGVRLLIATLVIAFGVPLVSQGWQAWRLHGTVSREVAGNPPALDDKAPLLIDDGYYICGYGPCAPVLWSMGESGAYGLPFAALDGRDLSKPVALSDLPLELWQYPTDGTGVIRTRPLSPSERQEAARRIDYLVLVRQTLYADDVQPVETALRQTAGLNGPGMDERVHLLMAPVAGGRLDLTAVEPDVLDLVLIGRALALPLAPYNTQAAANEIASREALIALFCRSDAAMSDWNCRNEMN